MRNNANTIEKLLVLTEPVTESGCWIFHGTLDWQGYARITFQGSRKRVHRLFYEHFRGPIYSPLEPDHLCRVHCCVNPWHLELVTSRENTLRGNSVAARNANKTHCIHGHEYTPENTIARKPTDGRRRCRICERANERRRYHERKKEAQP
jgi:HNH endonuclease